MKIFSLYFLLFVLLLSSCNRGVFVTIDNEKYDFGENTIVTFTNWQGSPSGYGFEIRTFKRSGSDSSSFLISAGKANIPITAGDYSFPNNDRTNFSASSISFYDKDGKKYMSGGDAIYGTTFVITSLTKKRAKGWFKGKYLHLIYNLLVKWNIMA